ncbi:peptidase M28 [Gemmatirosa kalamazoonensis]|uniref:Peptidase M28 n=1 Tax=Gemmatirosa kalamazoonensis TaxID=861299 RepID=W0RFE6_9BACT|nr:peptidase M28 [Gemmatirosa kalamazoonensis]
MLVAVVGCAGRPEAVATPPAPATPLDSAAAASEAQLRADVAWLAAPARNGRYAGTRESDSVAAYLERRYQALGIAGAYESGYRQRFRMSDGQATNVAAVIPGTDRALAREVIVVGAHRDHIGHSAWLAMDPDLGPVLRPGADDNASGTAAVLEVARRLAARPTRRTVLVVHFDAEELGLLGSQAFIEHPPVARSAVRLMLNLDMVGRLRADRLYVEVARGGRAVQALVDSVTRAGSLRPVPTSETSGRSDQSTFAEWPVPAVALFTGFHADYHRASDTPARVNVPGIRRVVDVAESLVRAVANRP